MCLGRQKTFGRHDGPGFLYPPVVLIFAGVLVIKANTPACLTPMAFWILSTKQLEDLCSVYNRRCQFHLSCGLCLVVCCLYNLIVLLLVYDGRSHFVGLCTPSPVCLHGPPPGHRVHETVW